MISSQKWLPFNSFAKSENHRHKTQRVTIRKAHRKWRREVLRRCIVGSPCREWEASRIRSKAAFSFFTHFELALNKTCTFSVDGLPCPPGFHGKFGQNFTLLYCHWQRLRDLFRRGKSAWGKAAGHSCSTAPSQNWEDRIEFCIENTRQPNTQSAFYHVLGVCLCLLKIILGRL